MSICSSMDELGLGERTAGRRYVTSIAPSKVTTTHL